jgi:hypothetical protein
MWIDGLASQHRKSGDLHTNKPTRSGILGKNKNKFDQVAHGNRPSKWHFRGILLLWSMWVDVKKCVRHRGFQYRKSGDPQANPPG